jgi:hypothetical protein
LEPPLITPKEFNNKKSNLASAYVLDKVRSNHSTIKVTEEEGSNEDDYDAEVKKVNKKILTKSGLHSSINSAGTNSNLNKKHKALR